MCSAGGDSPISAKASSEHIVGAVEAECVSFGVVQVCVVADELATEVGADCSGLAVGCDPLREYGPGYGCSVEAECDSFGVVRARPTDLTARDGKSPLHGLTDGCRDVTN